MAGREPVEGTDGGAGVHTPGTVGAASDHGGVSEIKDVGGFSGLATSPPHPPHTGLAVGRASPVETPTTNLRRQELFADRGQEVVAEEEIIHLSPQDNELRELRHSLEKSERARETLETMLRVLPQGGAAQGSGNHGGTFSGSKAIKPREYSPKGGVGSAKWMFHMEMFFEYARIYGVDRVRHATFLLRDAAEAWWREHVLETTTASGGTTAERITTWEALKEKLVVMFEHVTDKEKAREKLYDLKQTGSVQTYTQAFRELTFAIDDLSDAEKSTLYHRGLKSHILKDVKLRFPKSLEESIIIAESVDVVGGTATSTRTGFRSGGTGAVRPPYRRGRGSGASLHAVCAEQGHITPML